MSKTIFLSLLLLSGETFSFSLNDDLKLFRQSGHIGNRDVRSGQIRSLEFYQPLDWRSTSGPDQAVLDKPPEGFLKTKIGLSSQKFRYNEDLSTIMNDNFHNSEPKFQAPKPPMISLESFFNSKFKTQIRLSEESQIESNNL